MRQNIFEDLFVLEMANNHWGRIDRGIRIIRDFARVVRYNGVKAALKLQFRDVDNFIHKDFVNRADIRYIKKTIDTKMTKEEYRTLTTEIRKSGCIVMSTPFDEASVDLCVELGVQILKLASSDINDWFLIEKIAETKKPVIASTGGSSLKDMDDLVAFFDKRNIPLALNHCVSLYPTEDSDLELNQVDFLLNRYPNHVIGLSTHEYVDWSSSMLIAYAKGARTFERHVDIEADGIPVSKYCSTPPQVDTWFRAWKKAKEMCGAPQYYKRTPKKPEIEYLDALVRGVYAKRDIAEGENITAADVYLAIPLQKGQISCRELMYGETAVKDIKKDQPVMIDHIDGPYSDVELSRYIWERGL